MYVCLFVFSCDERKQKDIGWQLMGIYMCVSVSDSSYQMEGVYEWWLSISYKLWMWAWLWCFGVNAYVYGFCERVCVCVCKVTVTAVTGSFCQVWLTAELHRSENLNKHACMQGCVLATSCCISDDFNYFGLSSSSKWHALNTIT